MHTVFLNTVVLKKKESLQDWFLIAMTMYFFFSFRRIGK